MPSGLPFACMGQKIGLLGGSFDPPHAGHMHISRQALRGFHLDRVWWLVSPGNPLKKTGPSDFERRMVACRDLIDHPKVFVSDFEAQAGTRETIKTLNALLPLYPGVRFVWLMGADNLATFHRWQSWQDIMKLLPVGILARPGEQVKAGLSPAARVFAEFRLPASQAADLPMQAPPCWTLLNGPTVDISSTDIRKRAGWDQ